MQIDAPMQDANWLTQVETVSPIQLRWRFYFSLACIITHQPTILGSPFCLNFIKAFSTGTRTGKVPVVKFPGKLAECCLNNRIAQTHSDRKIWW